MNKCRIIITVLMTGVSFSLFSQSVPKNAIYIAKDTVDGVVQSIYIDPSSNSPYYNDIAGFKFGEFNSDAYNVSLDYFKEKKIELIKAKPVVPWLNWVTLKQYKNKFYAYHPSDFMFHFQQSINDSTFIDWTGEGLIANKIRAQRKIDADTYELSLTGEYDKDRMITIHIIDRKKGIAVFESRKGGGQPEYYLMIAQNTIRSVPVIVNYSPAAKQIELDFDEPDFEALLKTRNKKWPPPHTVYPLQNKSKPQRLRKN